jgi:crossover junction endodeoxyribonuclease RusA
VTLELALPWPPSLNRIWRAVNSRILLSAVARQYHKQVNNALVGLPVKPILGLVSFTMDLHPPHTLAVRGYDAANREKITCDALTKQRIWRDDAQIDELHVYRRGHLPDHPDGLAVVTIAEISTCID